MTQKKQPITAAECMTQLENDPAWVAKRAERDAEHQRRIEEARRHEAPLLADLRAAGFAIDSPWELMTRGEPQPAAIPILIEHFQRPYPGQTRELIARTIGALQASPTWDASCASTVPSKTRRREKVSPPRSPISRIRRDSTSSSSSYAIGGTARVVPSC
jgi:hypothetical protein